TKILVREIRQKLTGGSSNCSTDKQLRLEKLIENQDIQIEVSYGDVTEDKPNTDGFHQAIEQLGSNKAETRLGAIYTLEQIAKDVPAKQWTIVEILAAFIRENAPVFSSDRDEDEEVEERISLLPTDIQAALTAIARRDISKEPENQKLDLRYINISNADLTEGNLQDADFTGSDLRGVIFYGANLKAADFSGVNLQEAVMYEADLHEALFYEANLQMAILRKANLKNAIFYGADLQSATLYDANLSEAIFYQAKLQATNFCDANLARANLEACNLTNGNLIGANLQGANLIGANLQNATFSTANLQEAILLEAVLSKTNFSDANLSKANLVGANLAGTIFQDANLNGADLSRVENLEAQQIETALGDSTTILPDGLAIPSHWTNVNYESL
ncbi:pentapeptide repeat-containing protein, partial [Brunnivagina elsteri]